jgi:hypothetical protein
MNAKKRQAVERHNARYLAKQRGETIPEPSVGTIGHKDTDIVAVGIDPGSEEQAVTTVDREGRIGVVCGGLGITGAGRSMARVYRDAALRKAVELINEK